MQAGNFYLLYISLMKKLLSFAFICVSLFTSAQTSTEIIVFDIKSENGQYLFSNPVNITNHKGYDNQPFFHPSKPLIYYSSFNDSGRSDIKIYDYKTGKTSNLTETNEREYSPTVTPDGKYISCIIQRDNGAQDLGKYPINGGKPEVLINNLKVGYHLWLSKEKLVLFVLGDSTNPNTMRLYDLSAKTDNVLAKNIGRSLQLIPGENAFSFVQNVSDKEKRVQKYDIATGTISPVTMTIRGQDFLTWLGNNLMLMGEGTGLYLFDSKTNDGWQPVLIEGDASLIKGITRVAVNAEKTKLAVVVSE